MFQNGSNFVFEFTLLFTVGLCIFFALKPFAKQINDFILKYSVGQRNQIHEKLKEVYIEISPQKLLNILMGFSSGFGLLAFIFSLPHFVVGLILFPISVIISWFIPGLALQVYLSRRTLRFNLQLIDALSLMSASLRAGQSITQAMELMVRELPSPISQEFEQVLKENRLGSEPTLAYSLLQILTSI